MTGFFQGVDKRTFPGWATMGKFILQTPLLREKHSTEMLIANYQISKCWRAKPLSFRRPCLPQTFQWCKGIICFKVRCKSLSNSWKNKQLLCSGLFCPNKANVFEAWCRHTKNDRFKVSLPIRYCVFMNFCASDREITRMQQEENQKHQRSQIDFMLMRI